MKALLKRNLKIFFRDKVNFPLSLLAIFIVVVLYELFLGTSWGGPIVWDSPYADILRYSWLMAGMLAIASVTTPMGVFIVIVNDKAKKISKGFYVSPLKRSHIWNSYMFSAFVASVVAAVIMAIIMTIFIRVLGGSFLTPIEYLQVFGIILLTSLSGTAMMGFMATFIKSHAVFTTISMIVGTLVGFLTGVYFPSGDGGVADTIIKAFPPSHGAMLLRQIITEAPMQIVFEEAPAEAVERFMESWWISAYFGDFEITPFVSVVVLVITALLFYGLSLWNMRKMSKA